MICVHFRWRQWSLQNAVSSAVPQWHRSIQLCQFSRAGSSHCLHISYRCSASQSARQLEEIAGSTSLCNIRCLSRIIVLVHCALYRLIIWLYTLLLTLSESVCHFVTVVMNCQEYEGLILRIVDSRQPDPRPTLLSTSNIIWDFNACFIGIH